MSLKKNAGFSERGVTLIETVVAVGISSMVLLGASVYMNQYSKLGWNDQNRSTVESTRNVLRNSMDCLKTFSALPGGVCPSGGRQYINVLDRSGNILVRQDQSTKIGSLGIRAWCDSSVNPVGYTIEYQREGMQPGANAPVNNPLTGVVMSWASLMDIPVSCSPPEYLRCASLTATPANFAVGTPVTLTLTANAGNLPASEIYGRMAMVSPTVQIYGNGGLDSSYQLVQGPLNLDAGTYLFSAQLFRNGNVMPQSTCSTLAVNVTAAQCSVNEVRDLFNPLPLVGVVNTQVTGKSTLQHYGDVTLPSTISSIQAWDNEAVIAVNGNLIYNGSAESPFAAGGLKDSTVRDLGLAPSATTVNFNSSVYKRSPGQTRVVGNLNINWEVNKFSTATANLASFGNVCYSSQTYTPIACVDTPPTTPTQTGSLYLVMPIAAPDPNCPGSMTPSGGGLTYSCKNGSYNIAWSGPWSGKLGWNSAYTIAGLSSGPLPAALSINILAPPPPGGVMVVAVSNLSCPPPSPTFVVGSYRYRMDCNFSAYHPNHGTGPGSFWLITDESLPNCVCQ